MLHHMVAIATTWHSKNTTEDAQELQFLVLLLLYCSLNLIVSNTMTRLLIV